MLELELNQVEDLLHQQKEVVAEYITRNLSGYSWFESAAHLDVTKMKEELKKGVMRSNYASDFTVLKKYYKK